MTNHPRPAVNHTHTDHVHLIWFLLEPAWRVTPTLWRDDKDPFVCICKCVRLAASLTAAGAANDMVACLPLLIYLSVLEWAEPAEV